jgi:hypothetical protein
MGETKRRGKVSDFAQVVRVEHDHEDTFWFLDSKWPLDEKHFPVTTKIEVVDRQEAQLKRFNLNYHYK